MKFWNRVYKVLNYPVILTKNDKRMKKISDELHDIAYNGKNKSAKELTDDLKRLDRIQEEFRKTEIRMGFKNTSNKMHWFMWFVWWLNIGTSMREFYLGNFTWLDGAFALLWVAYMGKTGQTMIKNEKKREELFLEGIG